MVRAFCRRCLVIVICLYLLVGRYMNGGTSGLRNESSKTKRTRVFQRITAPFPLPLIIYTKRSLPFSYQISLYSGTQMKGSKRLW